MEPVQIWHDIRLSHDMFLTDVVALAPFLSASFAFRRDDLDQDSIDIAERIRAAWPLIKTSSPILASDLWTDLIVPRHAEFIALLESGTAEEVAAYLCRMAETPLTFGFMNYHRYQELVENEQLRRLEAIQVLDKIISLGESRNTLDIANPEQGHWTFSSFDFVAELIRAATREGRIAPAPRAAGGAFGLATPHGIYTMRDIIGLYTANRIAEILAAYCGEAKTVVEIGGGLGILAYYAFSGGVRDYTIYDLPTVGLAQAYFLMRSLGQDAVTLWGENDSGSHAKIKICPHWACHLAPRRADLVVNQDSLPEINEPEALRYLMYMKKSEALHFLSINQESQQNNVLALGTKQGRVWALAEKVGGFTRLYRFRDWMRKGYVEELYAIR